MIGLDSTLSRLGAVISGLYNSFFGQSLSRAKLNVMDAYDQSNDLFKGFLSEEMMYSCALWSDEEGGLRGDLFSTDRPLGLEAAQLRKIRHVLTMARVKPGMKVLEFGSGWGAMAIEVSSTTCEGVGACAHTLSGCPFVRRRGRHPNTIYRTEDSGGGEDQGGRTWR